MSEEKLIASFLHHSWYLQEKETHCFKNIKSQENDKCNSFNKSVFHMCEK